MRNLNGLFGPIKLLRDCYQPLETCGKCLFPLEIQLGIVAGVATPVLADWVARGAADLTQRQLLQRLRFRRVVWGRPVLQDMSGKSMLQRLRFRRVVWGVGTWRKVTQAMAEIFSVHRLDAQVEQVLCWLRQAANAYRALDTAGRLLTSVSAPQADEIEKAKTELLRLRFDEQMRSEKRKSAGTAIESSATTNLKPWREVVTPHKDIASGRYQQAEFAADLWQVHLGEGTDEYKKPVEFFRRTYLTESLKKMLVGLRKSFVALWRGFVARPIHPRQNHPS